MSAKIAADNSANGTADVPTAANSIVLSKKDFARRRKPSAKVLRLLSVHG